MTDQPPTSSLPSAPTSPPPPSNEKKARRWPRRIRTLVVLLLLIGVLSRIVVAIAFPVVLKRVAGYYGLDCSYDRLELSMLSGDAGLWHLTFTPKGETEPIFNGEYVRGDISTLNLLRGRLDVWRVEADGVEVLIDREPDGSIPILKLLGPKAATTVAAPVTATSQPSKAIDLSAPLRMDALRLTHIRARIRDRSVSPTLDTVFTLNLRLSNLGWVNTPVHFALDLDADPILDAAHIEGDGKADSKSLQATLKAKVDGLRLHPLEPYLRAFGVSPVANEISLKAGGDLKLAQSTANPAVLAGSLKFDNVSAIADGEEAAGLDHFTLDADAIDTRTLSFTDLTIDEARLNGRRSANGRVRFGGVEFIGVPPSTQPAAPAVSSTPITLPVISLATLNLQHLRAGFNDDAIAPPVALAASIKNFSLKNIVFDPNRPDAVVQLSGEVRGSGIFEKASFQGSLKPFATKKTFDMSVKADGIAPTALAPYFDALGIESRLHNGSFACDVSADLSLPSGSIAADAKVKNIKLSDSGDLIALDHAEIDGASYRLSPPLIHLKNIEIAGPVLSIDHEASGALTAVGFAIKPHAAKTSAVSSAAPPAAAERPATEPVASATAGPATASTLPSVQIDHFVWKGIDIKYADQSLNPPASTELNDAGVELNNILLDMSGAPADASIPTGTIHAYAKIPDLIASVSAEGTIVPSPAAMACDLTIAGTGFTATVVAPYLKSIGIEPTLRDGSFGAQVKAGLSKKGVSLDAEQIHLSDGDDELAGIDALKIGDTSLASGLLGIGAIEVDRPRINVTHDADGSFALAGVRLSPDLFNRPAPPAPLVRPVPATAAPSTTPSPGLPFDIALAGLNVKDATLNWTDHAANPDVQTSAVANLALSQMVLGKAAAPAQLHADVRVNGSIDSASADGTIMPSLDSPSIKLNVAVQGLRAGPLASYLPPGITFPMHSGQFKTTMEAGAQINPQGGVGTRFIVSDLDYRDQGQTQPLLKVDSFRAIASRIDPAGKIYAIDEVSSAGVETAAARTANGSIGMLGVELKPVAPTTAPAAPTTQAAVEELPTSTTGPVDVAAMVAKARERAPSVKVDKLDLVLKRFSLTDEMRPAAAPLVIADLHFRNTAAIDWGGKNAESQPPTPFRMDCTVDPVIGAVTLLAQVAPLASTPTANFDLTAADIRGAGLTELVPELKPYLDGSSLESGIFHSHVETQFKVNKKGPWQIDLSRGFSTDLDVKDIAFRATPGGPILLGLDNIHSDAIHITPASGDVHVKTLEITNPIGRVVRQSDGIHLAGLIIKLPKTAAETAVEKNATTTQPTTEEAAQATTAPATEAVAIASPAAPATMPAAKPAGEVRVDQLLISGIDFIAEDQTLTPPLVFPLNSLDVEVRDFSSLAPYEDKPIRFNALVNAGKVPLPKKAGAAAMGENMDQRELFAQASANGMIGLYPQPHGWVKTSMSGLELAGLKGAAKEAGVTLTGGVFDSTADARLPGDGLIHTSSHFVFTDLSLSEPPQGPIYRLLHLPAPLDVVIGALQDQEGSITVPIDVPVPINVKTMSTASLIGPAVGAFGSIVTTAIASAPLKAADSLAGLIGFGGNKKQAPETPVTLAFEPGYTDLSPADQAAIDALALRMKKDKSLNLIVHHDLGGGDLTVANERANPTTQEAGYLADQLRQQQINALQQRSSLAGQARAELAWGSSPAADGTIEQLRALDQQVAQNDDALDRLYGMLRPGADRQAARRTRGACLQYGRDRLEAVKRALKAAGVSDPDRVHIANPQFAQVPGDEGGKIVVTLVPKKKE